jgi:hypothetical protein
MLQPPCSSLNLHPGDAGWDGGACRYALFQLEEYESAKEEFEAASALEPGKRIHQDWARMCRAQLGGEAAVVGLHGRSILCGGCMGGAFNAVVAWAKYSTRNNLLRLHGRSVPSQHYRTGIGTYSARRCPAHLPCSPPMQRMSARICPCPQFLPLLPHQPHSLLPPLRLRPPSSSSSSR